ncbi:hypothetical protein [Simplicispira psychrophila]|uniref:hypothetical protein n=1 Tax=Simplicispira psychrophila TaxID=80882 RepID=UPI000481BC58|nr:hypothetical protein [Simplicispira psychrophila]
MKTLLASLAWLPFLLAGAGVHAQGDAGKGHSDKETQMDVQRHRAMAAAHEAAAQCLESGKGESVCQKELLAACKGLAIGPYCGMKHAH